MKLALQFPEFRVTGQYRITGKMFALSIEGTGPFWAIISNQLFTACLHAGCLHTLLIEIIQVTSQQKLSNHWELRKTLRTRANSWKSLINTLN